MIRLIMLLIKYFHGERKRKMMRHEKAHRTVKTLMKLLKSTLIMK